jgi:hypothetical protein
VCVQSHRTWSTVNPVSQKRHCGSVIPFIRGPWGALVYPVLILEITTCSLLVLPLVSPTYSCSIFLPFMLLLPFLHRSLFTLSFLFLTIFQDLLGGGVFFVLLYVIIQHCLCFLICLFVSGYAHVSWYPQECYLFFISVHHLP